MQAQIIPFPKHPTKYHTLYYFRKYSNVLFHIVVAWSLTVFTLFYELAIFAVGVGLGVWFIGIVLLVNYLVQLGLKRKKQEFR